LERIFDDADAVDEVCEPILDELSPELQAEPAALDDGFVGFEDAWCDAEHGEDGDRGADAEDGDDPEDDAEDGDDPEDDAEDGDDPGDGGEDGDGA
jgi:hypothetical protein